MQNYSHQNGKPSLTLPSVQLLPSPFIPQPKATASKAKAKRNNLLYPLIAIAMLVISALACAPESSNNTSSNSLTDTRTKPESIDTASTDAALSAALILDIPEVLGLTVTQVADKLGPSTDELPFDAGDVMNFDEAGMYRDYKVGKYLFTGYYDTSDVLQGIQLMDGLSEENYSLDDWSTLLARFGLPTSFAANSSAPAALKWDNLLGHWVWLVASSSSGEPVWTIQVWLVDRAVAKADTSPAAPTSPATDTTSTIVAVPNGATVNAEANLRSGSGTDFPIVGRLAVGSAVQIISCNADCTWYEIGTDMWIAAFLVTPDAATTTTLAQPKDFTEEELSYDIWLTDLVERYDAAFEKLLAHFDTIATTDGGMENAQWVADFGVYKAAIQNLTVEVKAKNPPTRFAQTHSELVMAAEYYDELMVTFTDGLGLDSLDDAMITAIEQTADLADQTFARAIDLYLIEIGNIPEPGCPQAISVANVRSGPDTSYPIVGSLTQNECVTITGRSEAGDWYEIGSGRWVAEFLVVNEGALSDIPVVSVATPTASESPSLPATAPVQAAPRQEPQQVTNAPQTNCDPNYSGACIPNVSYDLDCPEVAAQDFYSVGSDPHDFDRDGDGLACES